MVGGYELPIAGRMQSAVSLAKYFSQPPNNTGGMQDNRVLSRKLLKNIAQYEIRRNHFGEHSQKLFFSMFS